MRYCKVYLVFLFLLLLVSCDREHVFQKSYTGKAILFFRYPEGSRLQVYSVLMNKIDKNNPLNSFDSSKKEYGIVFNLWHDGYKRLLMTKAERIRQGEHQYIYVLPVEISYKNAVDGTKYPNNEKIIFQRFYIKNKKIDFNYHFAHDIEIDTIKTL